MCYHISFEVQLESILDVFPDLIIDSQLDVQFPVDAYINGFDHRHHQVMVRGRKDDKRHLALMMWGFLPENVKNMAEAEKFWEGHMGEDGKFSTGYVTLNAMGEELLQKPMYRDSALNRRCIIFVSGFYEWKHVFPTGKKGQPLKTSVTRPYHIYLKDSPYPFIMIAGIWKPWKHEERDPDSGELKTIFTPMFSMATAKANTLMAEIHNKKKRMPTILTRELAEEWVQNSLSEKRITEIATYQYAAEDMGAFTIRKDFQQSVNPKEKFIYDDTQAEYC